MTTSSTSPKATSVATLITRNNRRWARATKAQRRVLIAKDVLERLATKQYTSSTGVYERILGDSPPLGASLQDLLLDANTHCRVCARGALFLSHVVFRNEVLLGQVQGPGCHLSGGYMDPIQNAGLSNLFSVAQLRLIEGAFEGWYEGRHYAQSIPDDTKRLVDICRNIMANKGTFRLPRAKATT